MNTFQLCYAIRIVKLILTIEPPKVDLTNSIYTSFASRFRQAQGEISMRR